LFLMLAVIYQSVAWINITISSGAPVWDFVTIVRAVTLAALVLALALRDRRADWAAGLVILGMVVWRLAVQPVGDHLLEGPEAALLFG
ncbi:MAG TPA: hypothetical protein VM915_16595, partial [Verrucomicrobiae bacterium]|nr:hypothetical protein [Verrucomicrobiae bacterium]